MIQKKPPTLERQAMLLQGIEAMIEFGRVSPEHRRLVLLEIDRRLARHAQKFQAVVEALDG